MNFPAASDADEFKFRRHQHKLLGLCDLRDFCLILADHLRTMINTSSPQKLYRFAQAHSALESQEKSGVSGLFVALPRV